VLGEHSALLFLGLTVGIVSALVAVLPALLSPAAELPWRSLSATLGGVFAVGLLATWLATRWALRGKLTDALRSE
jgi:ABC-type antimicrobial peptide transport system permease subunit